MLSQRTAKENNTEYKFEMKLLLLKLSSEIHGKDAFVFKLGKSQHSDF